MEVLISTFILSIGLLGLAALLPVGSFTIGETSKADRSAILGRAGMREVKVRRMLDPFWAWSAAASYEPRWVTAANGDASTIAFTGQTFVIDPLMLAQAAPIATLGATNGLTRITLRAAPGGTAMSLAEAQRTFMLRDDLVFDTPADVTRRPTALPGVGLTYEGNYSWFLTVTPTPSEAISASLYDRRQYQVSVVVCYKRDLNTEYSCTGTFLGGGEMKLSGVAPANPPLRLRENDWLLLCGVRDFSNVVANTKVPVGQWYRVAQASTDQPTSYVSLAGPDWNPAWGATPTVVAIRSVIGVYSTTVELERDALWTP